MVTSDQYLPAGCDGSAYRYFRIFHDREQIRRQLDDDTKRDSRQQFTDKGMNPKYGNVLSGIQDLRYLRIDDFGLGFKYQTKR